MKKWFKEKESLPSKIAYYSFYSAVIIEVLMVIIDKSNYTNPIEGRLFQLTFLLFLIKVCLTKYTRREYVVIFLFCLLGAVSYFITERNEIIRLVMFVAACKNIEMKKCLKMVFWLTLSGCLAIILLSVTGIYGAVSLTQDYGRGSIETRYTLGMGHPNALQCMVWALTALGLYLYREKMRFYHFAVVFILNVVAFVLSDSKTSFLVAAFTIAVAYLSGEKLPKRIKKLCAWLNGVVVIGSIGASIVMAANAYRVYNHDWHCVSDPVTMLFVRLNDLLNGRIRILTETVGWEGSMNSWTLFSGPDSIYYFDMGWVRLFYWYGIIPGCVFVAVIVILLIYFLKKEDYLSIALIAAISLYTIAEAHVISVYLARNYVFFLIGAAWCEILKSFGSGRVLIKNDK
ncbi:MAG: hypothetical protein SPK58_13035 [Lachnospiraceae bacterium]|nr:hypothetical protein [Lachnospiraceae bacterium]